MQFDSFLAFLDMGGYGQYVWSVYIMGITILLANVIMPKLLMKRFYQQQIQAREIREINGIDGIKEKQRS